MRSRSRVAHGAAVLALALCLAPPAFGAQAKAKRPGSTLTVPQVSRDKVICFALYTVNNHVLKLTAQLYPLLESDPRTVRLEVKAGGTWKEVARAKVIERGWTATFRVGNWDSSRDVPYRVAHGKAAFYTGTVLKDPVDKDVTTVVVFTGNSINPAHGGDIPRTDLLENVERIQPDLLFFSGDQVYDHNRHYAAWLKFGRDFGPVIRHFPTITIPDDHDVGQANLWGAGGKKSNTGAGHDGGYFKPVEYVKEVERAQTSHLPDPYDPTPIARGIGVYYTAMTLGRTSFAIIEDRKFKSGPQGLVPKMGPRPDHIRDPNYDPKTVDVPGATLLGERQLAFLRDWAADWRGADMKAVLSQTVFANAATVHGSPTNRLHADMDSDGWPQTGRNKALREIRKGFAVMLCGDQHLATVIHHGIDDFGDAAYSLCVPSIANLYLRWWLPLAPGKNRAPGMPAYCGDFLDGFGNKITMLAAANPALKPNADKLTTRAAGFGVARFNHKTRRITFECWPRNVDVTDPKARQYPGWPVSFDQQANYGRKAVAYLPTIEVAGMTDPVVQVIDEADGEIVYTLRIRGSRYRPKVFRKGTYTVNVGEEGTPRWKTLTGIKALDPKDRKTLKVNL